MVKVAQLSSVGLLTEHCDALKNVKALSLAKHAFTWSGLRLEKGICLRMISKHW